MPLLQGVKQAELEMAEFGPLLLIDTAGCDMEEEADDGVDDSKRNQGEARVALRHCQRLVEAGLKLGDIGVITPYSAQALNYPLPHALLALYCLTRGLECNDGRRPNQRSK